MEEALHWGSYSLSNIKMDDKFNNKGITKMIWFRDCNWGVTWRSIGYWKLYEKGHTQEIQDLGKKYFLAKTTKQKEQAS